MRKQCYARNVKQSRPDTAPLHKWSMHYRSYAANNDSSICETVIEYINCLQFEAIKKLSFTDEMTICSYTMVTLEILLI